VSEFWPGEEQVFLREGRVDEASRGRPLVLWLSYSSSCGEECGLSHWLPTTVIFRDGRHQLLAAGAATVNGVHSSRYENGILSCTQFQGGAEPVANDDGSFTVVSFNMATGQMVQQTLTWSAESGQLTGSETSAEQAAPVEGDCPQAP
jgi:hypothetical protein